MKYQHCCVDLSHEQIDDVQALIDFKDFAKDISRATFCKYANREDRIQLEIGLGYEVGNSKGLHCAKDWHVRYIKGIYHGKPAVAMIHSAIEYIFQ